MHRCALLLAMIASLHAAELVDLALGRPATASGEQDSGGNIASAGNDGDPDTRWCCGNGGVGNWWQVDLGPGRHIRRIEIDWEHDQVPYRYRIGVSADGGQWRTVVDADAAPGRTTARSRDDLDADGVRFVRVTVTGQPPGVWTSFWSCRVLGEGASAAPEPRWQAVPLVSPAQRQAGIDPGGEGCQRLKALAIDPVDGHEVFLGTDVGGIYRSSDGGARFVPAGTGFSPRGCEAFAADPNDPRRVLAVGTYPEVFGDYHGLWLSEDAGDTWKQVLPHRNKGYAGHITVAWDASSGKPGSGSARAYWAGDDGLWRSADGGRSWEPVPGSADAAHDFVAVHPRSGALLLAGAAGLRLSRDAGATRTLVLAGKITGLSQTPTHPETVWACSADRIQRSDDGGASFTAVPAAVDLGRAKGVRWARIAASPADPSRLLACDDLHGFRYWSHDGGATWARSGKDWRDGFLPTRMISDLAGDGQVVWHPTDAGRCWAVGVGDFALASSDGGRTFRWANNGNNGVMTGSSFTFNPQRPGLLHLGAQDYNGAVTADGGRTWAHVDLSRFRFGYIYGSYAAGEDLIFGGNGGGWGGPRRLHVMRGGNDPAHVADAGIELQGLPVCAGDPGDPQVLFAYGFRSADRAASWTRMAGCDGVLACDAGDLYGAHGHAVVVSHDHGASWSGIGELPAAVSDLAFDAPRRRLLVVAGERLWRLPLAGGAPVELTAAIPADQYGAHRVISVAIDPVDPTVQYVGSRKDLYAYDAAIVRSIDGGETWTTISRCPRLGVVDVGEGGREPQWLRVDPATRWLWVGTNCFGVWRFPPPAPRS